MSGWGKVPRTRRQKFCVITEVDHDETLDGQSHDCGHAAAIPPVEFRHLSRKLSNREISQTREDLTQPTHFDHVDSCNVDSNAQYPSTISVPSSGDGIQNDTLNIGSDSGRGSAQSPLNQILQRASGDARIWLDTVDMAVQRVTDSPVIVRRDNDKPPTNSNHQSLSPESFPPASFQYTGPDKVPLVRPGPADQITNGSNGPNRHDQSEELEDEFIVTNIGTGDLKMIVPKHGQKDLRADQVDHNPEKLKFTCCDILINLFAIGSYLFDVGTDCYVAYLYYTRRHLWWFILTLVFIFVPSITMTAFSLKWYIQDRQHVKIKPIRWISRSMFLFLQIGPIMRYIDTLIFGCRSRSTSQHHEKKKWYEKMMFEDVDSSLLRLIECFMEAAPQLCLQLYVLTQTRLEGGWKMLIAQIASCTASLISLAWSQVAYHRSLRLSLYHKGNMSNLGSAVQFFWRAFTICSRILAMAMFASRFKYWLFVFLAVHWVLMVVWTQFMKSNFCNTKCEEFFFRLVMAAVYIFAFLNLSEGHTRLRYLFYYTLMYLENAGMIVAWYVPTSTLNLWYRIPVLAVVFGGFIFGIILQISYYLTCHPNNYLQDKEKHIKVCRSWNELMKKPELPKKDVYILKDIPFNNSDKNHVKEEWSGRENLVPKQGSDKRHHKRLHPKKKVSKSPKK